MKNRFSILFLVALLVLLLKDLNGQSTFIKMKNGTQYSYPTSIIKKISFSNNQLVIDLINPTPIIIAIDSIQTIHFNQTFVVHSLPNNEAVKKESPKQLLTLLMSKNEKTLSFIRTFLITI